MFNICFICLKLNLPLSGEDLPKAILTEPHSGPLIQWVLKLLSAHVGSVLGWCSEWLELTHCLRIGQHRRSSWAPKHLQYIFALWTKLEKQLLKAGALNLVAGRSVWRPWPTTSLALQPVLECERSTLGLPLAALAAIAANVAYRNPAKVQRNSSAKVFVCHRPFGCPPQDTWAKQRFQKIHTHQWPSTFRLVSLWWALTCFDQNEHKVAKLANVSTVHIGRKRPDYIITIFYPHIYQNQRWSPYNALLHILCTPVI